MERLVAEVAQTASRHRGPKASFAHSSQGMPASPRDSRAPSRRRLAALWRWGAGNENQQTILAHVCRLSSGSSQAIVLLSRGYPDGRGHSVTLEVRSLSGMTSDVERIQCLLFGALAALVILAIAAMARSRMAPPTNSNNRDTQATDWQPTRSSGWPLSMTTSAAPCWTSSGHSPAYPARTVALYWLGSAHGDRDEISSP
jgi:hypothetical protein